MARMFRKRLLRLFFCSLAGIVFAGGAAGTATGPVDYVRSILDEVMAIQSNPDMEGPAHRNERKKLIEEVIAGNFAIEGMAEPALGDHWPKLDGRQRQEFIAVFRDLFQDSYTRMVLNFLRAENIAYAPPEDGGRESLVQTVIERPNENIPVNYRLERGQAGWRIRDVVIDGVSIVETYRSSFSRVIKTQSYQALLERLRLQQKAVQDPP